MKYIKLSDCSNFSSKRTSNIQLETYISTENMLPNKGGVVKAESIPECKTTSKYEPHDILLSNIRPYFCKIWYADKEGCCSNDVLVLKAQRGYLPKFLYYVLSDQNFFNYDTVTSKGTKMPRGSKNAIMKYLVPDLDITNQRRIASILSAYDNLIENNNKRIRLLEQMAENLYKEWFARFRFPGYEKVEMENGLPKGWHIARYGELCTISAGGDCPACVSSIPNEECTIPIYSNGVDNFGLYGFTNKAKIFVDCITISARGTVGFVCLRQTPFVPIVRLLSVIPKKEIGVLYLYHSSRYNNLAGNGTSQQQLTVPMLKKRKILVPSSKTTANFESFVYPIHEQIRVLRKQNERLVTQRELLIPRLMSGKLEVNVNE